MNIFTHSLNQFVNIITLIMLRSLFNRVDGQLLQELKKDLPFMTIATQTIIISFKNMAEIQMSLMKSFDLILISLHRVVLDPILVVGVVYVLKID
jgi:hypothetical protein